MGGEYGYIYDPSKDADNIRIFANNIQYRQPREQLRTVYSVFRFEVISPIQVMLTGLNLADGDYDSRLNSCGFPQISDASVPPDCLFEFLNDNWHPMPGYERISFSFTSPCNFDYEGQPIGPIGDIKMRMGFIVEALDDDCSDGDCLHSVRGEAHGCSPNDTGECGFCPGGGTPLIYLERISDDVWRIDVHTDFDMQDTDIIEERYLDNVEVVEGKGKGGKTKTIRKQFVYPTWGRGHMAFEILFIRTKI